MGIHNIVADQVTRTTAGAFTGELDISGISGDYTIHIEIEDMIGVVQIALQDTVDDFSANVVRWVKSLSETITERKRFSIRKHEIPALRAGTGSAELRLVLDSITGSGATITASAWVETP